MSERKNTVFYISLSITIVLAAWAIVRKDSFSYIAQAMYSQLTEKMGWFYLLVMLSFVIFMLIIAFSRWGKIRLGDDENPEYSTASWFAMLFGAGVGVGLIFWGISEPISHYVIPNGMQGQTPEAAEFAMKSVFMHWGIHPWANYCVIALALAYFQFRKKKPALISSLVEPLIGKKRVNGTFGKSIDIFAILVTVIGMTTSQILGVLRINSGLNHIFGVPIGLLPQIVIIIAIGAMYIAVSVIGIDKGVKVISDFSMYGIVILMIVAAIIGPSKEMAGNFVNGLSGYIDTFFKESMNINPYGDNSWMYRWRIFYWAWWIAWAPFVGSFIARISKGRTVKEFILGVVFAPAIGSFIWFAIFGTLGIHLIHNNMIPQKTVQYIIDNPQAGLFLVMDYYPIGKIISVVCMILLCTFFITSANSGTFVLGMLSTGGDLNPDIKRKITWGIVQSILSVGLLVAGGLEPLKSISIAVALPFIFIMIMACISIIKEFMSEENI